MPTETNSWCSVCSMPAVVTPYASNGLFDVQCVRCGHYVASEHPRNLPGFTKEQVANTSGYIRENQGFKLYRPEDLEFLRSLRTPTVGEKAEKLLQALARKYPTAGHEIKIPGLLQNAEEKKRAKFLTDDNPCDAVNFLQSEEQFSLLSFGWTQNEDEFLYLLFDYLRDTAGWITGEKLQWERAGYNAATIKIAPTGWEFLQSADPGESNTAFVAMWFNDEVTPAWEKAIFPAIQDAGYTPFRIDKKQHNNRIDDEIIASIRRCRFLVADFTGNRGGVYYEAGFAGGLGKPVIWTIRHDHLSQVHFDTRQFNHITWDANNLPAFREALLNRIEATIGRGPLAANKTLADAR